MADLQRRLVQVRKYWRFWIFGVVGIIGLLAFLDAQGIETYHSGNMVCGEDIVCEGYFGFNVPSSITNYVGEETSIQQLCFGSKFNLVLEGTIDGIGNFGMYRADNRYSANNPARWKPFISDFAGVCLNRGWNHFKINGTKLADATVKWGVTGTGIDPVWEPSVLTGDNAVTAFNSLIENKEVRFDNGMPIVKIDGFGGTMSFSMWQEGLNGSISYNNKTGKLIVTNDDVSVQLYEIGAVENKHDLGSFEYEIVLKAKPKSNVIAFRFNSSNSVFYYQPPLDEENLSVLSRLNLKGCNATDCWTEVGDVILHRPIDVIGSYAVYHAAKIGNEYKTGKAFHIYRPRINDSSGNEIWGELNITANSMTITINQSWLDVAVYPVIVDPTFGNTAVPASTAADVNVINWYSGAAFTPASAGTLTSLHGYFTDEGDPNCNIDFALYNSSSGVPDRLISNANNGAVSATGFQQLTATGAITQQLYWIGGIHDSANCRIGYDTGGSSSTNKWKSGQTLGVWPDPGSSVSPGNGNWIGAMYATYSTDSPAGYLDVSLNNGNVAVLQNQTFSVNASFVCEGAGGCGVVNGSVYHNITGLATDLRLNHSLFGLPFYNATGLVNQSTGTAMANGAVSSFNWTINATGLGNWSFTINMTNGTSQNGTKLFYVNISLPTAAENDCACPSPAANWTIDDGSACTLSSSCDITGYNFTINNGALGIQNGVTFTANVCSSKLGYEVNGTLPNAKMICGAK